MKNTSLRIIALIVAVMTAASLLIGCNIGEKSEKVVFTMKPAADGSGKSDYAMVTTPPDTGYPVITPTPTSISTVEVITQDPIVDVTIEPTDEPWPEPTSEPEIEPAYSDVLSGTYKVVAFAGQDIYDYFIEAANDSGMTLEEFCGLVGISADDLGSLVTVTFNADGTGRFDSFFGDNEAFTWTLTGSDLALTDSIGEVSFGTVSGSTVTVDVGGQTYVFAR